MIATLSQFHHCVHEVRNVRVACAPFRQELKVPLQNGTIVLKLKIKVRNKTLNRIMSNIHFLPTLDGDNY